MYKFHGRCSGQYTLIEILMVLSIIGILAGIILPSMGKARRKARFVRWLTYNAGYNRDTDTVINFNFENAPYQIINKGITTEAIKNSAQACDAENFNPGKCYGSVKNSPEWVQGGGRWPYKGALQFDGRKDYVEITENSIINFDPAKDSFTIILWAVFYKESKCYLFAKGRKFVSQYNCSIQKSGSMRTSVGLRYQNWNTSKPETMRWYHIALVNDPAKGFLLYVDGKIAEKSGKVAKAVKAVKLSDMLVLGGMQRKRSDALRTAWSFRGRIDEFLVLKRALTEKEIFQNYSMGNPY